MTHILTEAHELEVCCGSLQSAMNAVAGGAQRIELCSALPLDGITPSVGVVRFLREHYPSLRIHVLIRPREGDFVYSPEELQIMLDDIAEAKKAGATAIVSGALTKDNAIDLQATRAFIEAAAPLPFTFHRAFDGLVDRSVAMEQLILLGASRVLTSGGAASAQEGIPELRALVAQAKGRITILPGGGVTRDNAARILHETGATEIHGSCSETLPSGLKQTSVEEVKAILSSIQQP